MPGLCCKQSIEALVVLAEGLAKHLEVLVEFAERSLSQATRALGRVDTLLDQAGFREHPDMARDRRLRDRKRLSQLIHGRLAERKPRENRAPRGICEREQRPIEGGSEAHGTYILLALYNGKNIYNAVPRTNAEQQLFKGSSQSTKQCVVRI